MDPTISIKLIIFIFDFLLKYHCYGSSVIEGARDMELEMKLQILNKTPIKTIQTEIGDVFDCIDINKQPSLDHPLLKNHVIKSKPISHSINTMADDDHREGFVSPLSSSSSSPPFVKHSSRSVTMLRKLGCPDGTVPIRRTSKEDLIRAESFSKSQLPLSSIDNVGDQTNDLENPDQGQILSIAKTRKYSGVNYVGIQAQIDVYNPPVAENQLSTGQLWIENGALNEEFNSLQAGWIVTPSLYGDNRTRFFVKWQVHGPNKSEGCYNIFCPGFIQINKAYSLGGEISPTSQYKASTQYEMKIAIYKDGDGNWWLEVEDMAVGYWPSELGFSQLTRGSPIIAWGGLAAQLGGIATAIPPTGNGHYAYDSHFYIDFRRFCYMRVMKVMPVTTLHWEDPTRQIIDTFATNNKCSKIYYYGQLDRSFFQHTIGFGGPGGYCSQ